MNVISAAEAARICGVTTAAFIRWVHEGRIEGAQRIGNVMAVPADFKVRSRFPLGLVSRLIPKEHWQTPEDKAQDASDEAV